MSEELDFIDQRVQESLDYLSTQFDAAESYAAAGHLGTVLHSLREGAQGGKHLRSRLVHIAAGKVEGEKKTAAVIFGAAIDMLHTALLVHDDVIDQDPLRRGLPTIHARLSAETGNEHVGNSMGILAGDLGLIATFQLLSASPLNAETTATGIRLVTRFAAETISGEILDVSHSSEDTVGIADVRASNYLKTGLYSFTAPLHLGAVAAGEDTPELLEAYSRMSVFMGQAYQAADDLAGTVGSTAETGKVQGGDLAAGRKTLLTLRLGEMDLESAVAEVIAEGREALQRARHEVDSAQLAPLSARGLNQIIDGIEERLERYAQR